MSKKALRYLCVIIVTAAITIALLSFFETIRKKKETQKTVLVEGNIRKFYDFFVDLKQQNDPQTVDFFSAFGKEQNADHDAPEYLEACRKKAENGDQFAQFILSCWLSRNENDMKESLTWMHKSAENGFELAQFYLALNFFYGYCNEKDYVKALQWVSKLADRKEKVTYGPAMFLLSRYCFRGLGNHPKDEQKAIKCLHEASDAEFYWADYLLYLNYSLEKPPRKNIKLALKHLRKAAEGGIPEAQIIYGTVQVFMFDNSNGIKFVKQGEQAGLTVDEVLKGREENKGIFTFGQVDYFTRHLEMCIKKMIPSTKQE